MAGDFSNKITESRNTVNAAAENVSWIITDGRAGLVNQARGLAEAIGLPVEVKTVAPLLPWTVLPVTLWPAALSSLSAKSSKLEPPWPRIAVGCGWRAIPYMLEIKRRSGGRTFTVQLQDPRIDPKHFDLVVPPEHDHVVGTNVVSIVGSPNGITRAKLDDARAKWAHAFEALPRPRVAVLIGGASNAHRFGADDAKALAQRLKALDAKGAGLMITTSRRTGAKQTQIIKETLAGTRAYMWDGAGDNPYLGLLAHADAVLVTSDSTNMVVEAATAGVPVYVVEIPGGDPKFDALHRRLKELGVARDFAGEIERWRYEPLDETARVAALIRERIGMSAR